MPEIVGVDLGVRVAHVSTSLACFSFTSKKEWPRYKQLQNIADQFYTRFGSDDCYLFVEEPVVAGARNLRVSLQMAQLGGAILASVPGEFVPVSTWKKATVGKGNARKEDVRNWLRDNEKTKDEYEKAKGSQDWIDASCIRLYGINR